jgi:hypothetical protein
MTVVPEIPNFDLGGGVRDDDPNLGVLGADAGDRAGQRGDVAGNPRRGSAP